MGDFTVIFLSFTAVSAGFMLFRRAFSAFAMRELRKSVCVRFLADTIEIFAQAESFEYFFRFALFTPFCIRVYVAESDEEAVCIAETLARFYDFEIIKI